MRCPECEAADVAHRVFPQGSSRTLLANQPFFDENDRHHYHDLNITTTAYLCSYGHEWIDRRGKTCWCGWRNDPPERFSTELT